MEAGIAAQVRRQFPHHYTTAEVARLANRSVDTIRRWRREGQVVPSDSVEVGELTVHLYTQSDLDRLIDFGSKQRPGRKKKE